MNRTGPKYWDIWIIFFSTRCEMLVISCNCTVKTWKYIIYFSGWVLGIGIIQTLTSQQSTFFSKAVLNKKRYAFSREHAKTNLTPTHRKRCMLSYVLMIYLVGGRNFTCLWKNMLPVTGALFSPLKTRGPKSGI